MSRAGPIPRVVALVPAWKSAAFIVPTLESLAAQTHSNFEVLISDDASPDETASVCERFAAGDARFRVVRQPRNLGWVGNVNALLALAEGDYLVFAFQDDLPAPTYFERCVDTLEANPRAIVAYTDLELVNQDGTREEKAYATLDGVRDRLRRAREVARQTSSWWIPNRGLFRAAAAREIGGLRHNLAWEFSADWPWLLHLSLLGEFVRVPERLCTKIYLPQSVSRAWDFGGRSWLAVTLSAMAAVRRARIPVREKLVLHLTLTRFAGYRVRRALRRKLQFAARRLGWRGAASRRVPEDRSR